jgi:DNA-binding Lrp family transcriptional regulator
MELDDKDITLLLDLIRNARTPLSALSQNVGLSVSSTAQRVTRLETKGIIRSYKVVLNLRAFPFDEFDIYYVLTDASANTLKHALGQLSNSPFTTQVLETMGACDIRVTMLAKNTQHLQEILREVEQKFAANIRTRTILSVTAKYKGTPESFLSALFKRGVALPKKKLDPVYERKKAQLDSTDSALMQLLAKDPKISYANLAKQVKLTPEAVSYRVKQLEKQRIILGYTTLLNGPVLGFRWAVLLLQVRMNDKERTDTIKFIQTHSNVTSAVETLGEYNLSVTIFAQTIEELHRVELDFRQALGGNVTSNALLFILENRKYPELATGILE